MPVSGQLQGRQPGAFPRSDQQAVESGTSSPAVADVCFVPGVAPHPRRHAGWHSFGQPEPTLSVPAPDQWQTDDAYRYGVDLYNFAFVVGMS
jgi:hypothetical protein